MQTLNVFNIVTLDRLHLGYSTYTQLFDACVSIQNYVVGIWGFKEYKMSNGIQNTAIIRCSSLSLAGDMGCLLKSVKRNVK